MKFYHIVDIQLNVGEDGGSDALLDGMLHLIHFRNDAVLERFRFLHTTAETEYLGRTQPFKAEVCNNHFNEGLQNAFQLQFEQYLWKDICVIPSAEETGISWLIFREPSFCYSSVGRLIVASGMSLTNEILLHLLVVSSAILLLKIKRNFSF